MVFVMTDYLNLGDQGLKDVLSAWPDVAIWKKDMINEDGIPADQ